MLRYVARLYLVIVIVRPQSQIQSHCQAAIISMISLFTFIIVIYLFINYNTIANYIQIIYELSNFDHKLSVVLQTRVSGENQIPGQTTLKNDCNFLSADFWQKLWQKNLKNLSFSCFRLHLVSVAWEAMLYSWLKGCNGLIRGMGMILLEELIYN